MLRFIARLIFLIILGGLSHAQVLAAEPSGGEFFEKEVRPLLVEQCIKCHGGKTIRGGLTMTSRAALLQGGDRGPAVVPGKPDASLFITVLLHKDKATPHMPPPPNGKLKEEQIAVLRRWIKMDLPWPETAPLRPGTGDAQTPFTEEERRFWSFQPVASVAPPVVQDTAWPQTDVDRFILARLEAKGLKPARRADKHTLIRRATFDLTGLPPTPEEIAAFEADASAEAFARVVDRLLASPHHGERWGRHWLDVVRYADSSGRVSEFREIWRYRDWVTEAFNRDMPYKDFLTLQLAGDLMQPEDPAKIDPDALIATGVLAIAQFDPGNASMKLLNAEYVDDQIDVVGRAFLGLTLACARCHDHKFDPISTQDYYSLAGIFFNTRALAGLNQDPTRVFAPLLPRTEVKKIQDEMAAQAKRQAEVQQQLRALPVLGMSVVGLLASRGPLAATALIEGTSAKITTDPQQLAVLRTELETLKKKPPPPIPQAVVVRDGGHAESGFATVKDAPVYLRGNPDHPGKSVPRGFPRILAGEDVKPIANGSGRLELARWLTRPEHPLTARVLVNRLWQHHFGQGIVRSANNFGARGDRPSHPELLDHLAGRFVQSGWSLKAMHRLMMLSSVYQQESRVAVEELARGPDNQFFGRMNRQRLEGEAIRDSLLAVAGRLDTTRGGPGFRDLSVPRRTHYLMTVRSETSPAGFGPLFDRPDPSLVSEKRDVSTVAPQALFFLNDPFVTAQAKALAARLTREVSGGKDVDKIQRLYLLAFGRAPSRAEVDVGLRLLAPAANVEPWERYCQLVLCGNEFIYVD